MHPKSYVEQREDLLKDAKGSFAKAIKKSKQGKQKPPHLIARSEQHLVTIPTWLADYFREKNPSVSVPKQIREFLVTRINQTTKEERN